MCALVMCRCAVGAIKHDVARQINSIQNINQKIGDQKLKQVPQVMMTLRARNMNHGATVPGAG